jgi:saccharopine dehydrogenase-like NADP-dependent oxidoreductase
MKNIVVLGAGLVGRAIAIDLAKKHNLLSVDKNEKNLALLKNVKNVKSSVKDISLENNIIELSKDADLIIGAVPGFMGFEMLRNVIKTGTDIVDISFFPENPLGLNQLALDNNVTAIVDCGVSPGMGNILLGHHLSEIEVNSYKCLVGGLPKHPEKPWGYKAVFSPIDVIEEYTRSVRYKENGKQLIDEPLTKKENIFFDNIGEFEAWNTDGLRTLLDTTDIPNMIELTIRYPGTIEPIIVLRDSGFFSYEEFELNGKSIRPIDLTAQLMFEQWKMKPNEHDMTLMRIIIEGKGGEKIVYDLADYYDAATETTSMARTTGYTCTAAANIILENKYDKKGVIAPEILGQDDVVFEYILNYLEERGIIYTRKD